MCGIAGWWTRRPGTLGGDDARRAANLLGHRGPDDQGTFLPDGSGLGLIHTRLSIIDLDGGHQPIHHADRPLVVVANGEIYNYIELRAELEAEGCRFTTHSDSETILHAYAVWGRDFLPRLHGMFAFALWDGEKQELLLARDRLGMKPLFVAAQADRVSFGSEIKALLPLLGSAPAVHAPALAQFLENQFSTGDDTIFDGVERLAPASALVIDSEMKPTRWTYWSAADVAPIDTDQGEAAERFTALMDEVMREHVRSDVPYGLFLSGGVDSAVLLGLLREYQDRPVRTFCVGWKGATLRDELADAKRIATHFEADHAEIVLDQEQVFRRLPYSVWLSDDLMRDYACLPTSVLAQRAGEELKVVFSGEGGDESFAGYGRYRPAALARLLKSWARPGSGGFRTRGQLTARWIRRLAKPELAKALADARQPFVDAWGRTPSGWSFCRRAQYTDLTTALPDNLLVKADRMLMGFGVEGRVPFVDHRVVEFGLALPDRLKVGEGQGKLFLKRWAERTIPKDHLAQKKRGFYVPVREWLGETFLRGLADKLPQNAGVRQWFDLDVVGELIAAQLGGQNVSREIWCLLQFSIWHRLFVEAPGAAPAADEDPLAWVA